MYQIYDIHGISDILDMDDINDIVRIGLAHLPTLHNRKHTNNISEQPNPHNITKMNHNNQRQNHIPTNNQ